MQEYPRNSLRIGKKLSFETTTTKKGTLTGADACFPLGGGVNPPGGERQHTNLADFPKNCMQLPPLDPPLINGLGPFWANLFSSLNNTVKFSLNTQIYQQFCTIYNGKKSETANSLILSRNCVFVYIKSLQCYELTRRSSEN